MKKLILCLFTLLFCVGCSSKDNDKFISDKKYEIVSYKGVVEEYKPTTQKRQEIEYKKVWQLQDKEVLEKYSKKTVSIHHYIVKNHPLGKDSKDNVNVYLITYKNKIIGSYSTRLDNNLNIYSIDGKSYEDLYGIDIF